MKKYLLMIAALLLSVLIIFSISSIAQGTWTRKADFGGDARKEAVGFGIGTKGYIGTGETKIVGDFRGDFWEYDPSTDSWSQKAYFEGGKRSQATGFSIGNKGYIGLGYSFDDGEYKKDFWEYDPATNSWTQKPDFGGIGRYDAVGFNIGNKGYIGTGASGYKIYYKDFWEYDPISDKWTRKADFGGTARQQAVGFAINNKGYLGTGDDGSYRNDFWEYDPASDKWSRKADFGGNAGSNNVGFCIGKKGYVEGNTFWEYDISNDKWIHKADFEGGARISPTGFSIGSKGYIGTGYLFASQKDFWEYTPEEIICDPPSDLKIRNVTDTSAKLSWHGDTSVKGFCIVYRAVNSSAWTERRRKPTDDHITLRALSPNTTYQWKMRSICKDGYSKWVVGPDFTTASLFASTTANISDAFIGDKFGANISPNPVTANMLTLHISNAPANNYQFSITDMQGRMLINQNLLLNSSLNKAIDVAALPKGIYILKVINSKNEQQQIKFMKAN